MTETELLDFARSRKGVDILLTRKEVSLWTRKTEPKEVARRPLGRALVFRPTSSGFDIDLNGIEVGSYGSRIFKGRRYVYGTGLAEPRFSVANKTLDSYTL